MSNIIHVCAAVICLKEHYLLTSRPIGKHLEGFWEFPGGKLHQNETVGECVKRELKEELGVEVIPLDLIYSIEHVYPEKTVYLEFVRTLPENLSDFKPKALEGQGIQWVHFSKLNEVTFVPADYPLAEYLMQKF